MSSARGGIGWAGLGLREAGGHVTVRGEPVPAHTDAWRAFFGDPPPGRSALDRRRAEAAAGPLLAPAIDWAKIKDVAPADRRGENYDALLNYGAGDEG